MKRPFQATARLMLITGMLVCISLLLPRSPTASAQGPVPTPTYDPLAQPPLPSHPTELDMGRYLFWRHCMPCHGDQGQGPTDEFRVLWEDHQNCWESGCHGGKRSDEGFPIPTLVPAIVTGDHLSQFHSETELFEYLKATHPPQYPGHLEEGEYRTLAAFVFTLNHRPLDETVAPTTLPAIDSPDAAATSSVSESMPASGNTRSSEVWIAAGAGLSLTAVILFLVLKRNSKQSD